MEVIHWSMRTLRQDLVDLPPWIVFLYICLLIHIPGAARVYPRICPISIPAVYGALRVSGLTSFIPWITGKNAAGGMAFFRLFSGWLPSFHSVLPSRPVGPIPRTGRLPLRFPAPQGRSRFGSGSGPTGSQKENGGGMSLRLDSFRITCLSCGNRCRRAGSCCMSGHRPR